MRKRYVIIDLMTNQYWCGKDYFVHFHESFSYAFKYQYKEDAIKEMEDDKENFCFSSYEIKEIYQ